MKKSITDIALKGKRCLVRVDFNVPLDKNGKVSDDTRITAALPTIEYLSKNGAKVILCSHLGRPKGEFRKEFSLAPVAVRLQELLGRKVVFATDVAGEDTERKVAVMKDGDVLLMENLRFKKEEEANDTGFCKRLASFAEVYVNDAFTFLKSEGVNTGRSLCEDGQVPLAAKLSEKARQKGVKLLLPVDHVVAYSTDKGEHFVSSDIPDDMMGVDIGPKTAELFAKALYGAKTVVWNGPMGVFENPDYAAGTFAVARAVAESGATSIVGGGDSVSAVSLSGLKDRITHVSTGGGASLEFLEGKTLPGVACLDDKKE